VTWLEVGARGPPQGVAETAQTPRCVYIYRSKRPGKAGGSNGMGRGASDNLDSSPGTPAARPLEPVGDEPQRGASVSPPGPSEQRSGPPGAQPPTPGTPDNLTGCSRTEWYTDRALGTRTPFLDQVFGTRGRKGSHWGTGGRSIQFTTNILIRGFFPGSGAGGEPESHRTDRGGSPLLI